MHDLLDAARALVKHGPFRLSGIPSVALVGAFEEVPRHRPAGALVSAPHWLRLSQRVKRILEAKLER